jgi:hypothetical protein
MLLDYSLYVCQLLRVFLQIKLQPLILRLQIVCPIQLIPQNGSVLFLEDCFLIPHGL